MNVGFIGLGIMGAPMALNILKHGNRLIVFNRTSTRPARLSMRVQRWFHHRTDRRGHSGHMRG